MTPTAPLNYSTQPNRLFNNVAEDALLCFFVAENANRFASSANTVIVLTQVQAHGNATLDTTSSVASSFIKKVGIGESVVNSLNLVLAAPNAAGFMQRAKALEAAAIFKSFNINNILVQYTDDDSVMFEFVQAGTYFLLEIFADGDIAYLHRQGREEPVAYDIRQEDLYATIESIYDITVQSNVQ